MKIRAKSSIAINGAHVGEGEIVGVGVDDGGIVKCDIDTANNLIRLRLVEKVDKSSAEKVDESSAEKVDEDAHFGKKQKTKSASD